MHTSANISGKSFAKIYGKQGFTVLDLGGLNVNGSLREHFENLGMKYICIDIEEHESVDIVVKPGQPLPFETGSIDLIVSTSCFEHDPCFWLTFRDMSRILKLGGYIYVNAPSNGAYHCHPGDNWRFYSDAGQALAYWSSKQMADETVYPMKVVETFHILPFYDIWIDFVCVWKRVDEIQNEITVSKEISDKQGPLQKELDEKTPVQTINKMKGF